MCILAGKLPPPVAPPATLQRRVVVQRPGEVDAAALKEGNEFARRAGGDWESLARQFPGLHVAPYFGALDVDRLRRADERARTAGLDQFSSYLAIQVPS